MKSPTPLILAGLTTAWLTLAPLAAQAQAQTSSIAPAAQSYMNLGFYDVRKQDFKGASEDFLGAWRNSPQSPQIWFDLGLAESKLPGYELRAICWFKLYLLAVPGAANAEAVRRQIGALEAAYQPRLRAVADQLETIVIGYNVSRPLDQVPAAARYPVRQSRIGTGWDVASLRYALGDTTAAEQGLRRTNGAGWRAEWDRSWLGTAPKPDLADGAAARLVAAVAAAGRLDQAWSMLQGHDNGEAVGFFIEQGDGGRAGRLSAVYDQPQVIKPCTPEELANDAADRYGHVTADSCGVAQWWAAGRAAFLLRTAVNGVKLNTDRDETQLADYLRDSHLETDPSELDSVTYELANLALQYRKARGLDRVAVP